MEPGIEGHVIAQASPETWGSRRKFRPDQVTVRAAKLEDIPKLQMFLFEQRRDFEQQDLTRSIIFIAEYEGEIVGFSAARLIWQVEPLLLARDFKRYASTHSQKRATYLLIRELDAWLADRAKNVSGIYSYFCSIADRTMQKLALSFGMLRVYRNSKFFGKDL